MSTGRASEARKRRRLTSSGDFDCVYRKGTSYASDHLVVYRFEREGDADGDRDRVRLGVSVSRKIGNAVKRNRIKRLLKEAFWSLDLELRRGCDYVVVARRGISALCEERGLQGFQEGLRAVLPTEDGGD